MRLILRCDVIYSLSLNSFIEFKTVHIIFIVLKVLDLGLHCLINTYYIKLSNEAFDKRFLIYFGFWLIFIL